jgi:L-lactate dehydrogenase complex protein LldG
MAGTIQNRESFLEHVASSLGRTRRTEPVQRPAWKHQPQHAVLKDATPDQLVEVLKTHCLKIHTSLVTTDLAGLSAALKETVDSYGGGPVVAWKDERFSKWGLNPLFSKEWPEQGIEFHEWDYEKGSDNITEAEKANIGIAISEMTLAESATVVTFSDKDKGRSVSFLPRTYIALIPKSGIVPRMTQAAIKLREIHLEGKPVSSCINFITGPSNSADIELNLVVGVHGPVHATYIVIEDL